MQAPVLAQPIPGQVINERAAYGPFNLNNFIARSEEERDKLTFQAELASGEALPKGMICTSDGILTGIPAKGTSGHYEVRLLISNAAGETETFFSLTIKESALITNNQYFDRLKAQIWEALDHQLPLPEFNDFNDRPITETEIYYLLERWATLTIWDAFNLEAPGAPQLLNLSGTSQHFNIYDRGSCLVATPKDLFSHARTLEDALQTARVMGQEVYKRGWAIELIGFEKMVRSAWVEIQVLAEQNGKPLEILRFDPRPEDIKLFQEQARRRITPSMDL